jgi:hypothetical protein
VSSMVSPPNLFSSLTPCSCRRHPPTPLLYLPPHPPLPRSGHVDDLVLRRVAAGVHSGAPASRRLSSPLRDGATESVGSALATPPPRPPLRLMLVLVLRRRREGAGEELREGRCPDADDGASASVGVGRTRMVVAARQPAGAVEVHVRGPSSRSPSSMARARARAQWQPWPRRSTPPRCSMKCQ